jgi:hypothetical protein
MKKCGKCGSKDVVRIMYGYPTDEIFIKYEKGEVELGGCCQENNAPNWHCKACENEWE